MDSEVRSELARVRQSATAAERTAGQLRDELRRVQVENDEAIRRLGAELEGKVNDARSDALTDLLLLTMVGVACLTVLVNVASRRL